MARVALAPSERSARVARALQPHGRGRDVRVPCRSARTVHHDGVEGPLCDAAVRTEAPGAERHRHRPRAGPAPRAHRRRAAARGRDRRPNHRRARGSARARVRGGDANRILRQRARARNRRVRDHQRCRRIPHRPAAARRLLRRRVGARRELRIRAGRGHRLPENRVSRECGHRRRAARADPRRAGRDPHRHHDAARAAGQHLRPGDHGQRAGGRERHAGAAVGRQTAPVPVSAATRARARTEVSCCRA